MEKNVLVRLENVSKKFNDKLVIKNFSLDIYEGEFLTLLGPSGCGKTTVLRMINGLEDVTSGKVFIAGKDVTNLDATKREVNTVFQNMALFPKMTAWDNIAFGLKIKGVNNDEINTRVAKVIKLVKLDGLEKRYPSELSGGQQQRVAIARGIVLNPKVLLLDESLCSLDLQLKKKMQVELKRLQKKLGITFIYVTHAQDEALSMSDRIVVMNKGVIEQADTPNEIYHNPKTLFVADFIGEANIINAKVVETNKKNAKLLFNGIELELKNMDFNKDENIKLVIRPEHIKVSKNVLKNGIKGTVVNTTYNGDSTKLIVNIVDDFEISVLVHGENKFTDNDIVYINFDNDYVVPLRK